MPIVAYNDHPSLLRVAAEGLDVISAERAAHQDIRELHIGFFNMMPDAAFMATERQFFRLVAASTSIVQIHLHPIKCAGMTRSPAISKHIDDYYHDFTDVAAAGLDALIVTGANPKLADLTQEEYWQHATELFDWADANVASVFFSCLASHAVLQAQYGLKRTPLADKLWGIYSHRVSEPRHPLVSNINSRFDMPHSRGNDVDAKRLGSKNLQVLVGGDNVGMAMAVSADGLKQVFCQGHPEYDTASLLKEYRREVQRFTESERSDYPPFPQNYLSAPAEQMLVQFKAELLAGKSSVADFPEQSLVTHLDNTWRDTAKAIFSNWIGLVYSTTSYQRQQQFMDGIDPNSPLGDWQKIN